MISNSQTKLHIGMMWLLSNPLNINPQFCRALIRRESPLADIEITSRIKYLEDSPCNTLKTIWDRRVKLSHFNYQVHWWLEIFVELREIKVDSCF